MKSHPHQPPSPPLSVPVRRVAPLLLLLVATACSAPYLASAFTQPEELSALILLRDALRARGGGDAATATWICDDTACDPCGDADGDGWGNWHYIGCRQQDGAPEGAVTRFHPTDLGLEGPVPWAELCPFKHLRELDLDGNKMTGPFPDWAPGCWPKLRELDLSWVPIGGQLPASLGTAPLASTLEELKLRHAGITGTLPPELGNMPRLRVLSLKGNRLSGTIPPSFAHGSMAAAIQQLDLQDNPGLIGPAPDFPTLNYACCWCQWRHCGVYLQGTSVDVSAVDSPVVKYGMSHRAEEPACEPACPWKSTSDPAPPDPWTLEREGVMRLDHSQRWDAGDLPPPDGSTCTERAQWNGCKSMGDMGFCQTTCGKWGA